MIERFVRYEVNGVARYGQLRENLICSLEGDIGTGFKPGGEECALADVRLLPPCQPSKIIALGINYRDHAEELGFRIPDEPLIFLKPGTAVVGPDAPIIYPRMSQRVDYEAELGVVIGKTARFVPRGKALDYIFGYTCVNDVTARDLQKKDVQFTRSKSFDTFAPIGPYMVRGIDPGNLRVQSYLNGELRQSSYTSHLVYGVADLISFISEVMTLLPGDIIATGTPAGVGPMFPGDVIEVVVEGIGTLRNTIEAERSLAGVS